MTPDPLYPDSCPHWCTADHSLFDGEAGQVHIGVSEQLTGQITARLVASSHPDTGAKDGPYLLFDAPHLELDCRELDLAQARNLGTALIELAAQGANSYVEHLER